MITDDTEKDTEILKKKIGADFKSSIKNSSNEYMKNLLDLVQNGFKNYYDELNKKLDEELNSQETQQKLLHDNIEIYEKKILATDKKNKNRLDTKKKLIQNFSDLRRKAFLLKILKNFHFQWRNLKMKKFYVNKIFQEKLKRKGLNFIKTLTILEKTKIFENDLKEKTEKEFTELEDILKAEKEKLSNLIQKAEEKLKHENRKKIQTKLQLDQIVLRGVTAMNIKALTLSQTTLNDVLKADYLKEYDKKYATMLLPNTNETLSARLKK